MTEPTEAGRQLAADLANAEGINANWKPLHFGNEYGSISVALARLATQSIARDAELAEVKSDLREIDRIARGGDWEHSTNGQERNRIAAIAAKHREVDPLVEALDRAWDHVGREQQAKALRAELAKRGIELKGAAS